MTGEAMAVSTLAPQRTVRSAPASLDPRVVGVLRCAGGPVGLNLLLLFGHEPTACDTAQGFAQRLPCPAEDVEQALQALVLVGIVRISQRPGDPARTSYWLSDDAELFRVLGQIVSAYASGPDGRRLLFRALAG